jgi:hypothetical protein
MIPIGRPVSTLEYVANCDQNILSVAPGPNEWQLTPEVISPRLSYEAAEDCAPN